MYLFESMFCLGKLFNNVEGAMAEANSPAITGYYFFLCRIINVSPILIALLIRFHYDFL